ncbi:MAG: FG-GAP-like repeat-containing protein, partial [Thiotrichaceae bacterium]
MKKAAYQWFGLSVFTVPLQSIRFTVFLFLVVLIPIAVDAAPVGTVSGAFAPTSNGAASYTVPLNLPAGIGGMHPDLSLIYSSDSGNGIIGIGWNLSGLSSVSRCGLTLGNSNQVQEVNLHSNNFCLDGQKLVPLKNANDSALKTHPINDYSRTVKDARQGGCNGPCGFTRHTKDGLIYEYGYEHDAKIDIATGEPSLGWAVKTIRDTVGNTITFHYQKDDSIGMHRIHRIDYTTNVSAGLVTPTVDIEFKYSTERADSLRHYSYGAQQVTNSLLTKIIVRRGTNKPRLREYRLVYETQGTGGVSLLGSLTECGFNKFGTEACFKPTQFDWLAPKKYFMKWRLMEGSKGDFDPASCRGGFLQGDVDGDGSIDIICAYDPDSSGKSHFRHTYVKLSSRNYRKWEIWFRDDAKSDFALRRCQALKAADVNGDGLTDLVCAYQYNLSGSVTKVQLSRGNKFTGWTEGSASQNRDIDDCALLTVGEVNGDGRKDLICLKKWGDTAVQIAGPVNQYGTWSGFSDWIDSPHSSPFQHDKCRYLNTGDANSDGLTDIICAYDTTNTGLGSNKVHVLLANGGKPDDGNSSTPYRPYTAWETWYQATDQPFDLEHCTTKTGDMNGDGLLDLVCLTGNTIFVQMSKGSQINNVLQGYTDWQNWGTDSTLSTENCAEILVSDVDADQKSDLICVHQDTVPNITTVCNPRRPSGTRCQPLTPVPDSDSASTTYVKRSNGTGFFNWEVRKADSGLNLGLCNKILAGDTDGDGHNDLTCIRKIEDGHGVRTFVQTHIKSAPNYMIQTITDGLGNSTKLSYKPLTDETVYTKGAGAVYPQLDFTGALYVVSETEVSDGIGGFSKVSYQYEGAQVDVTGYGFLGFEKITSKDHLTGIMSVNTYRLLRAESSISPPNYRVRYQHSYPYLGRVENKKIYTRANVLLSEETTDWSGSLVIYSNKLEYEINGQLKRTIKTEATQLDMTFGNVEKVTVTTTANGEIFTEVTENTYQNNEYNWIIGRLKRSAMTKTNADGDKQTRTVAFAYDYKTGLLREEIVEPDNPQYKLKKRYIYDASGNRTREFISDSAADGPLDYPITSNRQPVKDEYDFTSLASGTFKITASNAMGHTSIKVVDLKTGEPLSVKSPNGLTTRWLYDEFSRQIVETRPDGTETTVSYAWCDYNQDCEGFERYKITTTNSGAPEVSVYFDSLGRELRSRTVGLNGKHINIRREFDHRGNLSRKSRPHFDAGTPFWTQYEYDDLNRVRLIKSPDGGKTMTDYQGLTTVVTEATLPGALYQYQQVMSKTVNAVGEEIKVTDAKQQSLTKAYDAYGNLIATTDPQGNQVKMSYDLRGNKIAMDDLDMGHWAYRYDALGHLRWQQNAKGQQTKMTYDALGRMKTRVEKEGATTWTYDSVAFGVGKLATITAPQKYFKKVIYDAKGRVKKTLTKQNNQAFWMEQTYDVFGRQSETLYPSGYKTKNEYNTHGYLHQVKDIVHDKTIWTAEDADADGNVTQMLLGNKLTTIRLYDAASGRIKSITTGVGFGSSIQHLAYQFDAQGNLRERVDRNLSNLTETFGYDDLNRLTSVGIIGIGEKTYAYDALGNMTTKGLTSDYRYGVDHNGGPHAVTYAKGKKYGYDANGNMTWGNGRNITWSSFNKPLRISKSSAKTTLDFAYGPDRARYRQMKTVNGVSTTILYLGKLYEQRETATSTEQKHFIYAGGSVVAIHSKTISTANTTHKTVYLHADHLGSTDVVTTDQVGNDPGVELERVSFSAFGQYRGTNWSDGPLAQLQLATAETTRGFTG